ncbi:type VI secretion system Vgr family protein [Pantoea sp. GD03673]|uniref:type VI secretion system Vgr family protein n=1 Tax=Pantoea sp. GD03673 TaxID=2975364 RepID=UPI0024485DB3|nr:type VI secretion system Vgr family protein [Pantoea sp. GD03673]MDH2067453.1 type VI secretion system tip protein VgrG [Pantoea sp. GD03673]
MTSLPYVLNADTLDRYHLQIKGCDIPLDVESFDAREALSECYRYILRTPAANELRLQDERQKEHIHLSTPPVNSELNLGYNVLEDNQKELRGEGAELRTDGHGVMRAAKGVFITADAQPQVQDKLQEMEPVIQELEAAIQEAGSLHTAAERAKAGLADVQKQTELLNNAPKDLQQQVLLLSAPSGIAQLTPSSIKLAAGQKLIARTGQDTDFSIAKAFRMAVGSTLSLFAKKVGIKLYAAAGKVDIQAQSDALDMLAQKDIQITSKDGKVKISAKTELLLECGGAWIQLKDGNIVEGGSGNVSIKCGTLEKLGPVSQTSSIILPEHCPSIVLRAAGNKNASVSL